MAILPILVCLIQFVGYHLTFNSGISTANELSSYHNDVIGQFTHIFDNVMLDFRNYIPTSFYNTFNDLLGYFSITNTNIAVLLTYMFLTAIVHLIFDIFMWIPMFFHNLLERWM